MWALIQLALKTGFKTSEFWLAAAGLAVTMTAPLADQYVAQLHGVAATHTGTAALVAALGAAVISGSYSLARAMTKGTAIRAGADTAAPSGNVVSPGPGSPTLEEAHRSAVVAAMNAVAVAQKALEQASNIPRPSTFGTVSQPDAAPLVDSLTAPAPLTPARAQVNEMPAPGAAGGAPTKANG